MSQSIKDLSKKDYTISDSQHPTNENITLGAILRIADASEKMAANYIYLEAEFKRTKEAYLRNLSYCNKLERRIAGLKGHINHLKSR